MAGFIYLPIPSPEMFELVRKWQTSRCKKPDKHNPGQLKQPYGVLYSEDTGLIKSIRRHRGHGVLRNLQITDKLYVLAHGTFNTPAIGAARGATREYVAADWGGGKWKQYSAVQLAHALKAEGLPMQFFDLRIFACYTGMVLQNQAMSFAQQLAQTLRGIGYNGIRVTGYTGEVKASYAFRQGENFGTYTAEEHKGVEINGEIFPARTRRLYF